MQVPVVHPRLLVALHEVIVALREDAQPLLAPGVFGYRYGAERDWHYAPAWRAFSDATALQASDAQWVAFTDVTSFFRSTSWRMVADAISPHVTPQVMSELRGISDRFSAAGLNHLPSGYSDARFLSNLVLARADQAIGIPFVRWVDDYRLFADSYEQASAALARLHDSMRLAGLEPNHSKTRIVPGGDAAAQHRNTLASVYHPDRDPPELVRRNLHRVFLAAVEDPIGRRRDLRFSLSRLAREHDPAGVDWAIESLVRLPWEAPRLVSYLANFADETRVAQAAEAALATAARKQDAWMLARLVPLVWRTGLSRRTTRSLADRLDTLSGSVAWGLTLRTLAHAGDERTIRRVLEDGPIEDHRAVLVALADIESDTPQWLCEREPALATALRNGPAEAPRVESLL
jgi:hypothetical protein